MHQDLHLLDIPERVSYRLCLLTHRCLLGKAPVYLSDYSTAHQYLKLLHDSTCIQPLVTGWWFRNIGSARTAVGHSLSRWPSTLCPMSCATLPSISIGWRSLFALLPKVYTLRWWWFWILEWKCSASWTSSNRSWTTASADRLPHRSLVPSSTWTTQNSDRSHPKPIAVLNVYLPQEIPKIQLCGPETQSPHYPDTFPAAVQNCGQPPEFFCCTCVYVLPRSTTKQDAARTRKTKTAKTLPNINNNGPETENTTW